MFWGINLPTSCRGPALCDISLAECALNSPHQLHLAVNESEGSFCYKLLFPKMLLQRGNETLVDLECWESFLPVVDFEPAQMFIRTHKTRRSWGWPICCNSMFLPLKFLWFLNGAAPAVANSPYPAVWWLLGHCAKDEDLIFCIKSFLHMVSWYCQHLTPIISMWH